MPLVALGARWAMAERTFRGLPHMMFAHEPDTLAGVLSAALARAEPDTVMIEQGDRRLTYGGFAGAVAALSAALDVAVGAHVALAMENRVEWMIGFVAIVAAGGVPVLINSRGSGEEIERAIRVTDCVVLIADRVRFDALAGRGALPVIVVDAPDGTPDLGTIIATTSSAPLRFAARAPEDDALILFSSGTTGHPKAIVHSQAGIAHALALGRMLNDAQDIEYETEFGPLAPHERNNASVAVISGPLFHVNGLMPYLRAIANGVPAVLLGRWSPDAVFDLLERGGVARLGLVPTMVFDLLASPRADALGRLRFMGSGTALLSPEIAARMAAALPDCLIYNGYGQSETAERSAMFGGRDYAANLGAVGRITPGFRIRTVRDDGSDADVGEPGEVLTYAVCNMTGYYGDAQATAATIMDGWVRSGDIGFLDHDGRLHIVDRKKNMVISGGENIYCAEVERVLGEHSAVVEALAYGIPDARLGERLVARVVLRSGMNTSVDDLIAYAKSRLAVYKVPREIALTHDPLPRTATGKILRGAVQGDGA